MEFWTGALAHYCQCTGTCEEFSWHSSWRLLFVVGLKFNISKSQLREGSIYRAIPVYSSTPLVCQGPAEREILILSWSQSLCSSTRDWGWTWKRIYCPFPWVSVPRLVQLCCKQPQNWNLPQLGCSVCESVRVYCTFILSHSFSSLSGTGSFCLACKSVTCNGLSALFYRSLHLSIFLAPLIGYCIAVILLNCCYHSFPSRKIGQNE